MTTDTSRSKDVYVEARVIRTGPGKLGSSSVSVLIEIVGDLDQRLQIVVDANKIVERQAQNGSELWEHLNTKLTNALAFNDLSREQALLMTDDELYDLPGFRGATVAHLRITSK